MKTICHSSTLAAPVSYEEAVRIQNHLRTRVRIEDNLPAARFVAGIDVGYDPRKNLSRAAIVLMDFQTLEIYEQTIALAPTEFPYIPGLLSFREAPVILKALAQLSRMPDFLMIDGHGIAHPRRLGIAAHIGVLTGLPALGVAKSRLCGRYAEPGPNKGNTAKLYNGQEQIGTVLRSRDKVKPLFISPGHLLTQKTALNLTLKTLTRYRLPEPTRQADKLSKMSKKELSKNEKQPKLF